MLRKTVIFLCAVIINLSTAKANYIFIPMDESQTDHLKAYGIAYWVLENQVEVDWLLNYHGGSFAMKYLVKLRTNS